MTEAATFKNVLIGKIHVARKQLALHEDSYRAILKRITGKESCSRMDAGELHNVLKEFERLGFKPKGGKRAGTRKLADSAQAAMIRALWLDLYHLGEINDPSEETLGAFVKRSCGIPALQWVDSYKADTVIKALRGWLGRIGFKLPTSGEAQAIILLRWNCGLNDAEHNLQGVAWKVLMLCRQMELLGIEETEENAPHRMAAEHLDDAIESYGRAVRAMKKARGA